MADIIQFGDYTFPGTDLNFSPNFGDVVPRTGRLPGVDGGYDEYGSMPAPGEVGNITLSFKLVTRQRSAMPALRDEVLALLNMGKQVLRWTPEGEDTFRFCWARVNNIRIAQQPSKQTGLSQSVVISFQVSAPTWQSYPHTGLWFWDGTYNFDGTKSFLGLPQHNLTAGTEFTITNNGTAPIFPILNFECRQSTVLRLGVWAESFGLQRISTSGAILDAFIWSGQLKWLNSHTNSNHLVVNCRAYTVVHEDNDVGNINSFANFWSQRAQFFRFEPGENLIRVTGVFYTEVGMLLPLRLTLDYTDGWK